MKKFILMTVLLLMSDVGFSASQIVVYPTYHELNQRINGSLLGAMTKTEEEKRLLKAAKARYEKSCLPKYQAAVNSKLIRAAAALTLSSGFAFVVEGSLVASFTNLVVKQSTHFLYRNFALASISGTAGTAIGIHGIGLLENGFQFSKSERLLKSAYAVLRCKSDRVPFNKYCEDSRAREEIAALAYEVGEITGRFYSVIEVAQVIYSADIGGVYCQNIKQKKFSLLSYDDIRNYVTNYFFSLENSL